MSGKLYSPRHIWVRLLPGGEALLGVTRQLVRSEKKPACVNLCDPGDTLRVVPGVLDAPPMPSHGGGMPENTPLALTNAVALGATMVETDVKRCEKGRTPDGH